MSTAGPPLDPDTLKQQNDQLWRLVERQRQVIFQLREELERALGGSSVVGAPTQASPAQASPASLATPSPALPAAAASLAALPPRTTSTNTAASAFVIPPADPAAAATAAAAAADATAGGSGSVPSTPISEEPPASSGGGLASAFGRLRLGGASASHASASARNHAGKLVAGSSPLARSSSSNPSTPRAPVFGVSLERAIAASRIKEGYELPAVVYRCIEYLDSQDAKNEEGIYRLSGSSATIRALKDRFNAEGDVDLCASTDYIDVHAVAGLLKLFFRELPGSLLTDQFHPGRHQ
ncbi:hypothetical protein AMAG_06375 [Allomyces macrogynus ATCC 38327]|uniref:Rho-GAP domain-containing protein n=1 Tax=Allomyces macrogynus (strain ATCC 38327) TaxID=578462 RepID=A0A0L0SGI6_ALLM3|nr:hypothetical protein AMAG_06375 [Allomyces macrogynus ATCC 38327]|eukprot:KNE61559.1 hypothetical protein AMAG_06375 [Allomyces macrogynus ATCC 38327]